MTSNKWAIIVVKTLESLVVSPHNSTRLFLLYWMARSIGSAGRATLSKGTIESMEEFLSNLDGLDVLTSLYLVLPAPSIAILEPMIRDYRIPVIKSNPFQVIAKCKSWVDLVLEEGRNRGWLDDQKRILVSLMLRLIRELPKKQ